MKKGFTLVELLAVIVVLGGISLIVIPSVQRNLAKSKDQTYNAQISTIEEAAKSWAADNIDSIPDNGSSTTITLQDLINGNYVPKDIKNPKTNAPFSTETKIIIKNVNENYIYRVVEQ